MPILQDRMITLIAAATTIYREHDALRKLVLDATANVARGNQDASEACAQLYNVALASSVPNDAAVAVAVERKHFELMASRNTNAKHRAETQRRLAGVMPRKPGPKSRAESAAFIDLQKQGLEPISVADEELLDKLLRAPTAPKEPIADDGLVHTIRREGKVEIETIVAPEAELDPTAPLIDKGEPNDKA